MIDWSKIKWNVEELTGVTSIEIFPTINGDENITLQINWSNGRKDVHVEFLKMPPMVGEIGE